MRFRLQVVQEASPLSCARPCAAAIRRGRTPSSRRSRNRSNAWAGRSPRRAGRVATPIVPKPGAWHFGQSRSQPLGELPGQRAQHAHAHRIAIGAHVRSHSTARPSSERLASRFTAATTSSTVDQALDRMAAVAVADHEHAVARKAHRLHARQARWDRPPWKRRRRQLVRCVASVSTILRPRLRSMKAMISTPLGTERHAVDRPVAALAGDGAVDVERAEGKLGLDERRSRPAHPAAAPRRRRCRAVSVSRSVRDHDLGVQQAAERRRDRHAPWRGSSPGRSARWRRDVRITDTARPPVN